MTVKKRKKRKVRDPDKMGQVSSIHITDNKHPEAIEGINLLATLIDRNPHDAVRVFFVKTKSQMPEILKFCREKLNIAI